MATHRVRIEWNALLLAAVVLGAYCPWLTRLPVCGEESRWAQAAVEMGRTGDWVVPRQQGIPLLSRPPLHSWTIGAFGWLVGDIDKAYTLVDTMAKERFHLRGKDRLPLAKVENTFTVMDFLGLKVSVPNIALPHAKDPMTSATETLMPFSARYPNQPLWIME